MTFLTADQRKLLAEGYRPFGGFDGWENLNVNRFLWDKLAGRLAARRAHASPEDWVRARQVVIRGGIPDVAALGGGNLTLSPTQASWVQALATRGQEGARAVFNGELQAQALVIEAARGGVDADEELFAKIHAELCSGQDTYVVTTEQGELLHHPIPKGRFKVLHNHAVMSDGSLHPYAPPDNAAPETARFFQELASEQFRRAHPAVQAAYILSVISHVHPFADANGRVSRVLASLYFYRAISVPLVVTAQRRGAYLKVVEQSYKGEFQPMVDFTFRLGIDTMVTFLDILAGPGGSLE